MAPTLGAPGWHVCHTKAMSDDGSTGTSSSCGVPCIAAKAAAQAKEKAKKKTGAERRKEARQRANAEAKPEGASEEYDVTKDPEATEYVFKGTAVLLTWQLEEHVDLRAVKSFFGVGDEDEEHASCAAASVRNHLTRWTFCTERGSHLHAHGYLQFSRQVEVKRNEFLLPKCLSPGVRIDPNKARGAAFGQAINRGHFYVFCRYKTTHIDSATNYRPGHDYKVCLQWIDNLWSEEKIERALECALEYRCATPQFQARYKMVMANRGVKAREEFHKTRQQELAEKTKPFRIIPEVEAWLSTFSETEFRYKFLCLYGPSQKGKTRYIASKFRKPFVAENAFKLDGYSPLEHDGIILEDVPQIWNKVLEHKVFFQSNSVATLQSSATNVYSIQVDTAQVPIVICVNDQDEPIPWHNEWISANMVAVNITEPTWITEETAIALDTVPEGQPRLEHSDQRPFKRARAMSPPPGLVGQWGFVNTIR